MKAVSGTLVQTTQEEALLVRSQMNSDPAFRRSLQVVSCCSTSQGMNQGQTWSSATWFAGGPRSGPSICVYGLE